MIRFSLKRLAFLVPQLLVVIIGTFVLLRVLPVDPVSRHVGVFGTPEAKASVERDLGLDRSLGEQLTSYLISLAQFDLGNSWETDQPVVDEIAARFPVTLQLTVVGFAVAIGLAVLLGMLSATRPGRRLDKGIIVYSLFAGAQPDFWWGLVFIYIFFVQLHWAPAPLGVLEPAALPPEGPTQFILIDTLLAGEFGLFLSAVGHYILPWLTIVFVFTGPLLKLMRQSALDVQSSEYLIYARASGMPRGRTASITFRNAFAPLLTLAGILFGFLLGGAVLIETVFSLDGLGRFALQSILTVDFPAVQGAVIVMTVFSLGVYLLMDLLHAVLDPRVRYASRRS